MSTDKMEAREIVNSLDAVSVPREAIDSLADYLIDANAASIQLNKAVNPTFSTS